MNAIPLTKKVKAEAQQTLTKRFALGVFKTVRAAASVAQGAPSQLAHSFADVRDAWHESQPKNV